MAKILKELYVKPDNINIYSTGLEITLMRRTIPSHNFDSFYNVEKFEKALV